PYMLVGGARYHTAMGGYDAFAYSLGADYRLNRYISVDLGFVDFGRAQTPTQFIISIPELYAINGEEVRRRAGYLLPKFHWNPLPRLTLSAGGGPALVETRVRDYAFLVQNPKVAAVAQDELH